MFVTWLNICYFFTFNKVFTSSIYITLIKIKGFLTPNHDSQKNKKKKKKKTMKSETMLSSKRKKNNFYISLIL